MVDPLHGDAQPRDRSLDTDRTVKIERLLLSGLDHYFNGRYERAIDIWTRVLFLDRSHARARAYIERARAALSERLRESEELVHTGVEAFERGDVTEARALLTSAVEQGGGRDEALTILDRLNRLEVAAGEQRLPPRGRLTRSFGRREPNLGADPGPPRVRVVPLVLLVAVVLVAGYMALSWGEWEALVWGQPTPRLVVSTPTTVETLPIPLGASVRVSRARRLVEDGRLHQALKVLGTVGSVDPLTEEADALRAVIQRELLSLPAASEFRAGPTGDTDR
jgi:tetratricopeptide (TPR) repeat protein